MAESDDDNMSFERKQNPNGDNRKIKPIQPPLDNNQNKSENYTYRKYNHNIAYDNRGNRYSNNNKSAQKDNTYPNRSYPQSRSFRNTDYKKQMSFREFIMNQDERITPNEAISKYEEYGKDYTRRKYPALFEKNNKLEWFRIKYHPYNMTLCKIRSIRQIRTRMIIFNTLYETGIFTSIFLTNACHLLVPLIDVINYYLDGSSSQDIIRKFLSLEDNHDKNPDMKPTKRKHSKSQQTEYMTEENKFNDSFKDLRNGSIHIENISSEMTTQRLVNLLKDLYGYSRVALLPPTDAFQTSQKAIVTFVSGTDLKQSLESVKQISWGEMQPNSSICYTTCPVIRVVKGPWSCTHAVVSHIKLLISIISHFDEEMMVFSNRFPTLPDYNPVDDIGASSSSQQINKVESDTESISSVTESLSIQHPISNIFICKAEETIVSLVNESLESCSDASSQLVSVLDSLVLYLRVVHSFDFYSLTLYRQEHDMPSRVQNIGVRKSSPILSMTPEQVNSEVIAFETRAKNVISDSARVGNKDETGGDLKKEQEEVEQFMEQQCVEVREKVWQCKICEKKFQGKEFVGKHINNKHVSTLENVKINTAFFNNFTMDRTATDVNQNTSSARGSNESKFTPSLSFIAGDAAFGKRRALTKYSSLNEPDTHAFDF